MRSTYHKVLITGLVICGAASWYAASAEPAPSAPPPRKSETEILIPPQGGTAEVPIHAGEVCILSFPEPLVGGNALASSTQFEIQRWRDDGVAVRALSTSAKTTTLALSTSSGAVKVNVTLVVVGDDKPALTLVRFRAVSAEAAFEARLQAAVGKRVAALETKIAQLETNTEAELRARLDGEIVERRLKRNETFALAAHERSAEHVVVHITQGAFFGDDGLLMFEVENRSRNAFRLAGVQVRAGDREVNGPTRLVSSSADGDPNVVPVGATARGAVVVHAVDRIIGKSLSVTVTGPPGSQPIQLDRGIVFR